MESTMIQGTDRTLAAGERIRRLTAEGRLGPDEVAKRCGEELQLTVSPMTVYKWYSRGCKADGSIVRLETVKLAGRVYSSWPAVLRFLAKIQGQCLDCD